MTDLDLLLHHDGSPVHVSNPAPVLGERVSLRLRIADALVDELGAPVSVRVRSNPDREPHYDLAVEVAATDGWTWWQADVAVQNPVHPYRWLVELPAGRALWINQGGAAWHELRDSEDFKLVAHPAAPAWAADSILYQVFPDRFARSAAAALREAPPWAEPAAWDEPVTRDVLHVGQQFYGGDLDGVVEHLDHLDRLGVTLLYLTPVFPAESNHRYNASRFDIVDPVLGGDEAFERLTAAAHARGLRVIGDLTSNHSGDAHEWFRAAHRNPAAEESAFYHWLDPEQETYVSWLGFTSLPKFNWRSAELRRRFIDGDESVVAKWLKPPYSLDGWRIDVANMTGRYADEDLNQEVRTTIRRTMVEVNPDTILIGESTNDAASDFQGDAWHGAMTYAGFTRPLWGWLAAPGNRTAGGIGLPLGTAPELDGDQFLAQHRLMTAQFPWRSRLATMNALDTHDTPRFAGLARDGVVAVAVGMSMALPGIPVVWAGDEFGLTGIDGEDSRTPIPWASVADPAVAARIDLYAELIRLRREHPALRTGGIRWLAATPELLVFIRELPEESVLVAAAREVAAVELPEWLVPHATDAVPIVGDATLGAGDATVAIAATGPSFTAWRLPGAGTFGGDAPAALA